LSTGLTYSFTSDKGEFDDRFRIKFSIDNSSTIVDDISDEKPEIQIFSNRDAIYLKSATNDALTGVIKVYNTLGVVVKTVNNKKEGLVEINPESQAGYYIVILKSKYGVYTEKVLITQ